jgi:hypothetical protein
MATSNRAIAWLLPAWEYRATNCDFIDLVCEACAETIRIGDGLVPGEYWGYESRDGSVCLGALSFPHTYESDYPHACYVCHGYLNTGLSPDGVEYVRENIGRDYWHLWGLDG